MPKIILNGMQINTLQLHSPPYTTSRHNYHNSNNTYLHVANLLLKSINFDLEYIKQWRILDSFATSHFLLTDASIDDERQILNLITAKLPDRR